MEETQAAEAVQPFDSATALESLRGIVLQCAENGIPAFVAVGGVNSISWAGTQQSVEEVLGFVELARRHVHAKWLKSHFDMIAALCFPPIGTVWMGTTDPNIPATDAIADAPHVEPFIGQNGEITF